MQVNIWMGGRNGLVLETESVLIVRSSSSRRVPNCCQLLSGGFRKTKPPESEQIALFIVD
jgi:hypothetical protein